MVLTYLSFANIFTRPITDILTTLPNENIFDTTAEWSTFPPDIKFTKFQSHDVDSKVNCDGYDFSLTIIKPFCSNLENMTSPSFCLPLPFQIPLQA